MRPAFRAPSISREERKEDFGAPAPPKIGVIKRVWRNALLLIRHPEVAERSEALEGRRPERVILRGAQERAPQDDDFAPH